MIVSRTAELRRLDRLLAGLLDWDGGALVVHGEAGIGKTTLLDALVERAGDRVTMLRASGVETEAELAFCALADLLAPLLGALDALPAPQRGGAGRRRSRSARRLPGSASRCAWRRSACCGRRRSSAPCSRSSTTSNGSTPPRASASSTWRAAPAAAGRGAGRARSVRTPPSVPVCPSWPLGPLDDDAAAELLRRAAPELAPAVAAAIAAAAAGNPLALAELPATLTAEQRAGVAALELPLAPGRPAAACVRAPCAGARPARAASAADRRGPRRSRADSGRRGLPPRGDRRGVARPRPRRTAWCGSTARA